jgi:NAD(P)-dependent dehydrogenase (short-subunit alcohol dehydrogenase family)
MLHKSRYKPVLMILLLQRDILTLFKALIGTVEELSVSTQTMNLVRDQFEVNYFGPLNIIKAALPHMRKERSGHIMIISGISKRRVLPPSGYLSDHIQRRISAHPD